MTALVLPAPAAARGRAQTVALDYRLRLEAPPGGVHLRILDGDRSLEARVDRGTSLVVLGLGVCAGVSALVATIGFATLLSLPVFWHGVVISALPADAARLLCGLALAGGAAAAALSLPPELDE